MFSVDVFSEVTFFYLQGSFFCFFMSVPRDYFVRNHLYNKKMVNVRVMVSLHWFSNEALPSACCIRTNNDSKVTSEEAILSFK